MLYGLLAYMVTRNFRVGDVAACPLRPDAIVIYGAWFFLCWTGVVGPVANWGHTAGVIGGLAWGVAETPVMLVFGGWRRGDAATKLRAGYALAFAVGCLLGVVRVVAFYTGSPPGPLCLDQDARSVAEQVDELATRMDGADGSARARLLVARGGAYRAERRFDLAIKDYDEVITADHDNVAAYVGRGIAKRNSGMKGEAEADIGRAKQMDAKIAASYPAVRYLDRLDAALVGTGGEGTAAGRLAQRGVVLEILRAMPPEKPSGACPAKRIIEFRTRDVSMPDRLRRDFPEVLVIVLQYLYKDLVVTEQSVAVTVRFKGEWQRLDIPVEALTGFRDETADFDLNFSPASEGD